MSFNFIKDCYKSTNNTKEKMPYKPDEISGFLKKNGIDPVKLAIELSDACIKNKRNDITKSLCINDDQYDFKIEGHFAQSISLFISDDGGQSWIRVDSWSDH